MFLVTIEDLTSEGQGVATHEGVKIFIEGALIGERVKVTLREKKKSYATADLVEVITPSPSRVTPPCPHFGSCGGCQLMHLSYKEQLAYKRKKVADALAKIAKLPIEVEECVAADAPHGYRNKMQLPLLGSRMGFFKRKSHEIIPISRCLIQSDLSNNILATIQKSLPLPYLRYLLIKSCRKGKSALVTFVTWQKSSSALKAYAKELMAHHPEIKGVFENVNKKSNSVILSPNETLLLGEPFITETLLNHKFMITSNSFFQVYPKQAEKLFLKALDLAQITKQQIVVDAYCGVGTVAILAAARAAQVIGIEYSTQAIKMAKANARLNHQENCSFYAGLAEKLLDQFSKIDTLFINPPRKGCAPLFIQKVKKILPKTLIYISCNPATLARDISLLPEYQPSSAIPFDLFPQTTHVETIIKLTKK